ncbi:MAG: hypothetical protein ACNS62_10535 [Candidatus Cyclobacteriaceae bacterium M3_2C_046]
MKIKVGKGMDKPFLENGRHTVKITDIQDGLSEKKEIPFFACRFENDDGFIVHRFYNTNQGMPQIISLFEASGIEIEEGVEMDTYELRNKDVSIYVSERSYSDPDTGNDKTIKQASDFKPAHQADASNATDKKAD